MLGRLSKAARIVIRDTGLTTGILRERNVCHGTSAEISRFYDQAKDTYARRPVLWEHERYIIDTYFPPPPARVLDIGCGGGRTTVCLAKMGYHVTGIDLSEKLIAWARNSFPDIDFHVMDAGHMAFADGYFDAALFSHNGLDYVVPVATRLKVLREINRVVRSGGRFYLSSHNTWGKLCPERTGLYGWAFWGYDWMHRLLRQVFKFNKHIFNGYWWYHDVDGSQLCYSAPPWTNIRCFGKVGWQPEAVLSRALDASGRCVGITSKLQEESSRHLWYWIARREHHVQYVLEKL